MIFCCQLCEKETCYLSRYCEKCRKIKHYLNLYHDRVYEVLDNVLSREVEKQNNKIKVELKKEIENKKCMIDSTELYINESKQVPPVEDSGKVLKKFVKK
jgi:predicted RNase H-like nuclease (RuvC/YqgF family)